MILAYAAYYALTFSQDINIAQQVLQKFTQVLESDRPIEKVTLLEVLDFLKICKKNAKEVFKTKV